MTADSDDRKKVMLIWIGLSRSLRMYTLSSPVPSSWYASPPSSPIRPFSRAVCGSSGGGASPPAADDGGLSGSASSVSLPAPAASASSPELRSVSSPFLIAPTHSAANDMRARMKSSSIVTSSSCRRNEHFSSTTSDSLDRWLSRIAETRSSGGWSFTGRGASTTGALALGSWLSICSHPTTAPRSVASASLARRTSMPATVTCSTSSVFSDEMAASDTPWRRA